MTHGNVTTFDTMLRLAWYSDVKYPLSAALYASSKLKAKLPALIMLENKKSYRDPQVSPKV